MNIEELLKENSQLLEQLEQDDQSSFIDNQLSQMRDHLHYLQQIDIKRQERYDELLNRSTKLQQLFIELVGFVEESQIKGNQLNTILRQYHELSFRSPIATEKSPFKPSSPQKRQKNYLANKI